MENIFRFLPSITNHSANMYTEKAEIGPPYLVEFLQYFREGHHVQ